MQTDGCTSKQSKVCGISPAAGLQIQDKASEMRSLLELQNWIEEARLLVSTLKAHAGIDAELEALLMKHGISFNSASWYEQQHHGLQLLNARQYEIAKEIEELATGGSNE
ncbi:hypothetical protein [Rhodoferax mekongensis]|uniref:hypothetical protein n=1 Tax=Rhodoferax mekongensis TaxID=3068341 RepID=UPI0028BE9763|nr:hypothetical protein [Rhodoferax sp. TBRC 17199]MDT7514698.1 hypothetical protein [Rhodoferax sp. TBRC 17199]